MEHNGGNQNMHVATLCRNGCGFYANSQFDGMCSKCYKDIVKRRQQNPSPTQMSGRATPTGLENAGSSLESSLSSVSSTPVSCATPSCTISTPAPNGASINTATPTVPSTNAHDKATTDTTNTKEQGATGGVELASASKDKESPEKEKKPKKNRCHSCKKKVGLTGFECRCGGMFCSLHRYSDKHDCTFNYKEMAQLQIRKNNPVVVGEKIQKI